MLIWWYAAFSPHPLNSESKAKVHNERLFSPSSTLFTFALFHNFPGWSANNIENAQLESLRGLCESVERARMKKGEQQTIHTLLIFSSNERRQKLSTFPSRQLAKGTTSRWTAIFVEVDVHIRNVNPRVSISCRLLTLEVSVEGNVMFSFNSCAF